MERLSAGVDLHALRALSMEALKDSLDAQNGGDPSNRATFRSGFSRSSGS